MGEKVTFDPYNKIIQVTLAPTYNGTDWIVDIDVKVDIYSDGKEDWKTDSTLNKLRFPLRAVGGNALPGEKSLGTTFFLDPDWKIRPYEDDHTMNVNGNLYSEDGTSPYTKVLGTYNVMVINSVSSLVDSTVSQLDELQYAAYMGAAWLDENSSYAGTEYPIGTREFPVNNWNDVVTISNNKGFDKVGLLSNSTINGTVNIEGYEIFGRSHVNTQLIIGTDALTQKATFKDLNITGVLDGGSELKNCMVGNLDYVNGHIHDSSLYGTITLGGEATAYFGKLLCYKK